MDINEFLPKTDDLVVELSITKIGGEVINLVNKDGSPMTITVMSPFSDEARQAVSDLNDRMVKKAIAEKRKELTQKEKEDQAVEILAITTKDWNITWNDEKTEANLENFRKFYKLAFWARDSVETAKIELLNFMKA